MQIKTVVGCGFGPAAVLTLAALAQGQAAPVASLNLPQTFAPVKQTLAAGGVGNIAVIGDSLSFRPGSWLYPFIANLQAQYGNAGGGYQGASIWTGGGVDANWTEGTIDQDTSPYHSLDGLWLNTTAATTASLQPETPDGTAVYNQSYTLQYITQPGGGSFQQFYWNPNGSGEVPTATISTNSATTGVGETTFAANATGTETPWYQTNGDGPVTLLGQIDSTGNPGVMVSRIANGGWGVNDYLQRDYTFDDQLKLLNPQLYFIWLGQNDQWAQTPAQYAASIEQLVNRIKSDSPNAQICLVGTYDQDDQLAINVAGMYEAAEAEDCGFLDLYDTAGNYQFFEDNGYLDDGVHFSTAGGEYMGNFMYNAFETDGASLVPEPASASFCLLSIGSVALLRRRRAMNH